FLAACRDGYRQWLNRFGSSLDSAERAAWDRLLDLFAREAKIDQAGERILAAKHLLRRHARDLEWANKKLRGEAIAGLTAIAREFKALPTTATKESADVRALDVALSPLRLTMFEDGYPEADRAAAAEALGQIGGPRAAEALLQQLAATKEPVAVRRAAAEALGLVDGPADDPDAHWRLLREILTTQANHLHGESFEVMDEKLPLLQGAARGLQRMASRSIPFALPEWGTEPGLKLPMLTLNTAAGAVTTRLVEDVEVWQLPLPGGVPLEVVKIPGGTYTIGSPPEEEGRGNYGAINQVKQGEEQRVEAQRQVSVPSFAMARFPLTQAQWRSLAGDDHRQHGDRDLDLDPAREKGADWPVESVNWLEASAWCGRLQRHLRAVIGDQAPRVGLPSESLWEVACRARSSTAFHFGDTIDATWGNYNGTSPYPGGRSGLFVNHPLAVGSYGLVNAWGLADVHGTLWEWCADVWHPDPLASPRDGSPRMDPAEGLDDERLLRGGSWYSYPRRCRSADRNCYLPPYRFLGNVGFRVCSFPQDCLLGPLTLEPLALSRLCPFSTGRLARDHGLGGLAVVLQEPQALAKFFFEKECLARLAQHREADPKTLRCFACSRFRQPQRQSQPQRAAHPPGHHRSDQVVRAFVE
ncbi:MAG: formylglycine-generating enzyme family protein, partial [Cyanobacteriota bacterium]